MKTGQSSVEFILIISFMMIVFVTGFSFVTGLFSDSNRELTEQTAQEIALGIADQFLVAQSVNDGFATEFFIPSTVRSFNYSLQLIDQREIIVIYQDTEYVEFLKINVSGPIQFGVNTLRKENGKLFLNS